MEFLAPRQCRILGVLLFLMVVLPGANCFFLDALGWLFSARNAVYGASLVVSFFRTAFRIFTLLDPTTGVINVLRGRREAGPHFDSLEDTLTKAPLQDHLECLPLVLCAIYAEPEAFTSPLESKFRYAFRSVFTKGAEPKWASKYIQAADEGETLKSSASCQSSYSSCPYSPERLRRLIFQTLDSYWLDYNNEVKT